MFNVAGARPRAVKLRGKVATSSPVIAHNGVTTDGVDFWVTENLGIYKYAGKTVNGVRVPGALVLSNTNTAAETGAQHCGGIQFYIDPLTKRRLILIAAENYTSPVAFDHQRIAIYDADTLAFIRQVDISAQAFEISGCTVVPEKDWLIVCSYVTSGSFYIYKLSDMIAGTSTYIGARLLNRALLLTQDITYDGNNLWIIETGGSNPHRAWKAALDGTVSTYIRAVKTNFEGIDYSTDVMYMLDDQGAEQFVHALPEFNARRERGANMVHNGRFRLMAEGVEAYTTADNRWLDNTPGGTDVPFQADSAWGWCTNNGAFASGAKITREVLYQGHPTLCLDSITPGTGMEVAPYRDDTAFDHVRYGILCKPNTNYTVRVTFRVDYTSGDSNDGAYLVIRTFKWDGNASNNNAATSTKVKTNSAMQTYTFNFTTGADVMYFAPVFNNRGQSGAATLLQKMYVGEIVIVPTSELS